MSLSVTKCDRVFQIFTEYYRVLQSISVCNRVLKSVTERYRVLQSVTGYVFLLVCVFECIATGATGGAVGVGAKQVHVFV